MPFCIVVLFIEFIQKSTDFCRMWKQSRGHFFTEKIHFKGTTRFSLLDLGLKCK